MAGDVLREVPVCGLVYLLWLCFGVASSQPDVASPTNRCMIVCIHSVYTGEGCGKGRLPDTVQLLAADGALFSRWGCWCVAWWGGCAALTSAMCATMRVWDVDGVTCK